MDINFPPVVRKTIYIVVVIGTAVVVPLNVANVVPDVAMNVWSSVAGAVSLLAAFNVSKK